MKIALCISGQPRLLRECYDGIYNNIIKDNDVDIFAHIWWSNEYQNKVFQLHYDKKFPQEDLGELFLQMYKPKDYIIEGQKQFNLDYCKSHNSVWNETDTHNKIFTPSVLFGLSSQYYSVSQADLIRQKYKGYDWVVRLRTDSVVEHNLANVLAGLDNNKFYFQSSMNGGHKYGGEPPGVFCDWFYTSGPEMMKNFTSVVYNEMPTYFGNGMIHVRDYMKMLMFHIQANAEGANFDITPHGCDSSTHQNVKKYYEGFDTEKLEVKNKEIWPYFMDKIDFKLGKNND